MSTLAYHDAPDPDPEDLHEWTARGFTVADARRWIDNGFLLNAAGRWRDRGVYRPDDALAWRTAGLTPYTVQPALRAGMTPADAVRWHELGYTTTDATERHLAGEHPHPRSWLRRLLRRRAPSGLGDQQSAGMRALLSAGVPGSTARAYLDTGWDGRDALPWATTAASPVDAAIYRTIGFDPAEAAKLIEQGHDAAELLTTWWDHSVPRHEVPAWVIAGYTAQQAAHARKTGTTADQAAVLRALGGGHPSTDPDPGAPEYDDD